MVRVMSAKSEIRALTSEDLEAVVAVSNSVWEDDYVPSLFLSWLSNPLWHCIGKFVDGKMVGFGGLQQIKNSNIAWIRALRVRPEAQRQHHGSDIVRELIRIAQFLGVKTLRYGTSSRNIASKHVAEGLGFVVRESAGYVRISSPFPPRPRSSPNFVPLDINADRLNAILKETPDLIENETIPFMWEFYDRDSAAEILQEMGARFRAIIDHDGTTMGVYLSSEVQRNDRKSIVSTILCKNQTHFVDIIARLFEEAEAVSADGVVFFLGETPRTWLDLFIDIPEDYKDRRYLLYQLDL